MTTNKHPLSLKALRLSTAELLASALLDLFPKILLVDGGIADSDFYYDFVYHHPLDNQSLALLEERMRAVIREARPVRTIDMMRENAKDFFRHRKQPLKVDVLKTIDEQTITLFEMGEFCDFSPAPHIKNSNEIGAFKLHSIAPHPISLASGKQRGWRIYGTAFHDKDKLKKYLKRHEEGKKRDHRKLGGELDLFSTSDEVGSGLWLWHPKGAAVRQMLIDWWNQLQKEAGFALVNTPSIMRKKIINNSFPGLAAAKSRFPSLAKIRGEEYAATPSFLPAHMLIYSKREHSYRELPLGYAELGEIYHLGEKEAGDGLQQTRIEWVDQAHLFCASEQLLEGLISSLQFIFRNIKMLGLECQFYLCRRSCLSPVPTAQWQQCEKSVVKALELCSFDYAVDSEAQSLYGPRIDVRLKDIIGREWVGPYVEVDLYQPGSFDLRYQGSDGEMHTPQLIARSTFGSLEHLMALLIEQYEGVFPLWLAPEQVRLVPVAEKHIPYAEKLRSVFASRSLRASVEYRDEKLGGKIHLVQLEKIPYIAVVGDKEEEESALTVRSWNQKELRTVEANDWIEQLLEEVAKSKIQSSTVDIELGEE